MADVRIGVSVQAQEVNLEVGFVAIDGTVGQLPMIIEGQTRAVCVFVGVQQDVGAVIFVVAAGQLLLLTKCDGHWW